MFPRLASLTVLKLPRRLALPVMMVGALEYSCAPDFSQLTMDNGVGGHAGSSYEFAETVAANSTAEKKVTVKMKELEKNQNGCQGKKVTLNYKVE